MMSYTGVVQKGEKRGAAIGFPTANILFDDATISGIYAAYVTVGDKTYNAAVYADQQRRLLEAYLLEFSGDLYGQEITIKLLKKIRDDKKFDTDESLRAAISSDVAAVRDYFKTV